MEGLTGNLPCTVQAEFGYDFAAVGMGRNRVIEVLPQALEECQRRFMNPFQRYIWTQVTLMCRHALPDKDGGALFL